MEAKPYFNLVGETKTVRGTTLFRVKYSDGRLGGFVQSRENLDGGLVLDDACVMDDSVVRDSAVVRGNAVVSGRSDIRGFALVSGRAKVRSSCVCDFATVTDRADARSSNVHGHGLVCDRASVVHADVGDFAVVRDAAVVHCATFTGHACANGDAEVRHVAMNGYAAASHGARISDPEDVLTLRNNWSSRREFTAYRCADGRLRWRVGCFCGTSAELVAKAAGDSELSGECYAAAVDFAERVFRALAEEQRRRLTGDGGKIKKENGHEN